MGVAKRDGDRSLPKGKTPLTGVALDEEEREVWEGEEKLSERGTLAREEALSVFYKRVIAVKFEEETGK